MLMFFNMGFGRRQSTKLPVYELMEDLADGVVIHWTVSDGELLFEVTGILHCENF